MRKTTKWTMIGAALLFVAVIGTSAFGFGWGRGPGLDCAQSPGGDAAGYHGVTLTAEQRATLKEMRLRPKIGEHDLESKVRLINKFLTEGDKVRVTVMFRGREITHTDLGWKLLQRVIQMLEGVGVVEKQAVMEGRRMFIIMTQTASIKSKPKEVPQDAKAKDA